MSFVGLVSQKLLVVIQNIISWIFAHKTLPSLEKPRGRIAIIGAGLTGVSSAAHCISHGFEVVIFEQSASTGGIWNRVNTTSRLQSHSLSYIFHPTVFWSTGFPYREEILSEIKRVWEHHGLESRTRFEYKVERVKRQRTDGKTKWMINDGEEGWFDGLIVAIGTCGPAHRLAVNGHESFKGKIVHSSELDTVNMNEKKVVSIGSGASGVEALELAVDHGAREATMLARTDKWFLPRNILLGALFASQPFSRPTPLSLIMETLLKAIQYRKVEWMVPENSPLYGATTPVVNDRFFELIRSKRVHYLRGEILEIVPEGISFKLRGPGQTPTKIMIPADVIVDASGYNRPSKQFLPTAELFQKDYEPPSLYLQTFSTEDWSCLMTNSTYENAIGTVGTVHIGIYTRILLSFLLEPEGAPEPSEMKSWVDTAGYLKGSPLPTISSFAYFTYTELMLWLFFFHFSKPTIRLKWILFNLFGFRRESIST